MKRVFNVYSDPGHGWIKVSKCTLNKLGIYNKITSSSYTRGEFVYLEEDCDGKLFINTLKKKKIDFVFKEFNTSKQSRIRKYDSFCV